MPSRHGAVQATAMLLVLASGCAEAHHVPPDPWKGIERGRLLELRGMVPGPTDPVQLPLGAVEDDPAAYPNTAEALTGAGDFAFVFRQGSNSLRRFDVLEIDAAGQATLTLGGTRQRATFRLSAVELDRLKKMLILIDVLHLGRSYSANADDGSQWFLDVSAGGQKKSVRFDNHFPAEAILLSEFLRKEILAPRRAEIGAAR
jgi:hypothetical protein